EVIQPHLPVRLPCYDFTTLVTRLAFCRPLLAVKVEKISNKASSPSVTGGVYKARERIHRRMADRRLLAIPASCRRVSVCNPHAPPVSAFPRFRRHSSLSRGFTACQALVRFFALHRIKPHAPPLVRAPVNSFEFHSCERTPQAGYLTR
ncbi:hypothetical protein LUZ61_022033, partial [Rhynchospora tenuis]